MAYETRGDFMIQTIIFDMDGTILNTLTDITISVNHALKLKGCKPVTEDQVRLAVGNGAKKLIERISPSHFTEEDKMELFSLYQDYYDQHSEVHTGPYEGILPLLKTLKSYGFKLAVVSNKYQHLVEKLNETIFESLFDVAIGETKGIPIKPAPDMVYLALERLNTKNTEALFVGDAEPDMQTAINASVLSVGVTWGFRTKEILLAHGAAYIISKPEQLLEVMEEVSHL